MFNRFKTFTLLCLLATSLVATPALAASDTPVLDRIIESQVLKVGMSGNQPPMNAVSRSGKLIGLEVDLAKAFASAMGVHLEIVTMPFGDLLEAMDDHKVDMVMSGMAITPHRSQGVSFVGPYMMSGKSILTKDTTLARISQAHEVNRSDIKLAALKNSTSEEFIKSAAPDAELVSVDTYDVAIDKVISGEIDGLVADMPICMLSVLRYPNTGLVTLKSPLSVEPFGIAVRKDDQQFAQLVEIYLDTFEKMGMLTELSRKWFEDKSWIASLP